MEDIPQFLVDDLDALWILLGAFLVFFMQCGFALLEAGTVQEKATKNILLKNVLDACLGAILWWSVGHSFAFGEGGSHPNAFIGGTNFFTSSVSDHRDPPVIFHSRWIFSWTFASTAATIVSGAVAERCRFVSYIIYTIFMTGWLYPIVVHWSWSREGWLSPFREDGDGEINPILGELGVLDFAGSGVVHVTGGGAALIAAYIIGPRAGRFQENGAVVHLPSYSPALATLGTFILWFGWYGFNTGSTQCMVHCMDIAAKISITTTVSAASSGLTVLVASVLSGRPGDVAPVLNGILAGLVSITAGCAVVEPHGACFIGAVGGIIYYASAQLLLKLRIDDPLEASSVHFFSGMWGVVSVGMFATKSGIEMAYKRSDVSSFGFLYGGGGKQFGLQILGALSIAVWTLFLSYVLFSNLERFKLLRLAFADEAQGVGGFGISSSAGNALGKDIRSMYSERTSMRSRSQLEDPIRVTTITPSVPSRAVELAQPGLS